MLEILIALSLTSIGILALQSLMMQLTDSQAQVKTRIEASGLAQDALARHALAVLHNDGALVFSTENLSGINSTFTLKHAEANRITEALYEIAVEVAWLDRYEQVHQHRLSRYVRRDRPLKTWLLGQAQGSAQWPENGLREISEFDQPDFLNREVLEAFHPDTETHQEHSRVRLLINAENQHLLVHESGMPVLWCPHQLTHFTGRIFQLNAHVGSPLQVTITAPGYCEQNADWDYQCWVCGASPNASARLGWEGQIGLLGLQSNALVDERLCWAESLEHALSAESRSSRRVYTSADGLGVAGNFACQHFLVIDTKQAMSCLQAAQAVGISDVLPPSRVHYDAGMPHSHADCG